MQHSHPAGCLGPVVPALVVLGDDVLGPGAERVEAVERLEVEVAGAELLGGDEPGLELAREAVLAPKRGTLGEVLQAEVQRGDEHLDRDLGDLGVGHLLVELELEFELRDDAVDETDRLAVLAARLVHQDGGLEHAQLDLLEPVEPLHVQGGLDGRHRRLP